MLNLFLLLTPQLTSAKKEGKISTPLRETTTSTKTISIPLKSMSKNLNTTPDYTGFTKSKKNIGSLDHPKWINVLVDAQGKTYEVAYTIKDLDNTTIALDLRNHQLDSFPQVILNHPQLQILILDGTKRKRHHLKDLPVAIHQLQNLQYCFFLKFHNKCLLALYRLQF